MEVQATIRRSSGARSTNARPSTISTRRGRRSERGGGCSTLRMRPTSSAESRKLTASAATSSGAASTRSSTPPTAGPATWATGWLACSFALPSTSRAGPTSTGR